MLAVDLLVGNGDDTKTILIEVGRQLKHSLTGGLIQRLDHIPILDLDEYRQYFLHGPFTHKFVVMILSSTTTNINRL